MSKKQVLLNNLANRNISKLRREEIINKINKVTNKNKVMVCCECDKEMNGSITKKYEEKGYKVSHNFCKNHIKEFHKNKSNTRLGKFLKLCIIICLVSFFIAIIRIYFDYEPPYESYDQYIKITK